MRNKKPFYITTTLPYVNAEPHIGHAMEFIRADAIARYMKFMGHEVFFNTGTDEHGQKIYKAALKEGIDPKKYTDRYAEIFRNILPALGMSDDINFIRTTDEKHINAAQVFWKKVADRGYIYKKKYTTMYCVGCELEKTTSELIDEKCPVHPNLDLEHIDEENYFFKFSEFQKPLLDLYTSNPNIVVPDFRLNEIKSFVERGLEDFSISRLAKKMPWGIPVPGDSEQVMYVWFDALVNYISAIGWPDDEKIFSKWWIESGGVVQYCGKDNLRQQSAMWQAMLMAVGLPPSKMIIINGFITGEGGIKMSKSLGNAVSPIDLINEYGTDAMRYYVLRALSAFEDSPFTPLRFNESYNAHLANGLGNLVSRVMKMAESLNIKADLEEVSELGVNNKKFDQNIVEEYHKAFTSFRIDRATDVIWKIVQDSDKKIHETEPFRLIKSDPAKAKEIISEIMVSIELISILLQPIMPNTSQSIRKCLIEGKMPTASIFPRK
jgi:methionyl-tRNA synthetase